MCKRSYVNIITVSDYLLKTKQERALEMTINSKSLLIHREPITTDVPFFVHVVCVCVCRRA